MSFDGIVTKAIVDDIKEKFAADCLPDRIQLPVGAADSAHQSQTERPAACRGGAGQPGGAGLL